MVLGCVFFVVPDDGLVKPLVEGRVEVEGDFVSEEATTTMVSFFRFLEEPGAFLRAWVRD